MTAKLLTALSSLNISDNCKSCQSINKCLLLFYKNLKGCQRSWPKANRKQKQQYTNNQTRKNKSKPQKKLKNTKM